MGGEIGYGLLSVFGVLGIVMVLTSGASTASVILALIQLALLMFASLYNCVADVLDVRAVLRERAYHGGRVGYVAGMVCLIVLHACVFVVSTCAFSFAVGVLV